MPNSITMIGENSELTCNAEHYTLMDNNLVRGKQDMTLQEAKLIRLLITQVVKEDRDFRTYVTTIPELAKFLGVSKSNLYRDIRSICLSLLQRLVYIGTDDPRKPWKAFQWISKAEYDGSNVTLKLSEELKPYVLELNEYFTQYQLANILELNSFYAIRMYELIKADEHRGSEYLEYTIDFLRQAFQCEDKYERISSFKTYVIDIAVREINDKTDITIKKVEYTIRGRATYSVKLYLSDPQYYKFRRTRLNKLTREKAEARREG